MFVKLQNWLTTQLIPKRFIALAVILVVCVAIFLIRGSYIGPSLDGNWFLDTKIVRVFCCTGLPWCSRQCRMQLYVVSQLSVDVVFPLAYSMLFGMLLVALYAPVVSRRLLIFPVLTLAFDFAENVATIYLAQTFDCDALPPRIPWLALVFTPCKWALGTICGLLVLCGSITYLARRCQGRTAIQGKLNR